MPRGGSGRIHGRFAQAELLKLQKSGQFPDEPVRIKVIFVYYESIKRELKIRGIYECRCDERLQTKTKEFTRLTYTGLVVELEHLKIETRLIDEKFPNVMGEYVTER